MTGLAAGGGGIGKGGWAFGTGGEAAARAERNNRDGDGWVGGMWTGGRVVPRADSHQLLSGNAPTTRRSALERSGARLERARRLRSCP
jgi:hypothetical protein